MLTTSATIVSIDYSPSREVVILHCKPEEIFVFQEWQFMVLQVEIDGQIIKRSYSIYSTNQQLQDSQIVSFCIKHKEWGVFSTRATQVAKVDMKITMTWPVGKFVDPGLSRNYLFISVGSGLSPCFSVYQHLLQTWLYNKIVNLFGERYLDHIPAEVLEHYSFQNEKIYNQICLSKEDTITQWMRKGHVQDGLEAALEFLWYSKWSSPTLLFKEGVTVFICWLPAMCDDVSQILQDQWIPQERIVIEKY